MDSSINYRLKKEARWRYTSSPCSKMAKNEKQMINKVNLFCFDCASFILCFALNGTAFLFSLSLVSSMLLLIPVSTVVPHEKQYEKSTFVAENVAQLALDRAQTFF